jgi:hypothetical protein
MDSRHAFIAQYKQSMVRRTAIYSMGRKHCMAKDKLAKGVGHADKMQATCFQPPNT